MKILKLLQTLGVLLIIGGFGWLMLGSQGFTSIDGTGSSGIYILVLGLIIYGIGRFMLWFQRDS